MGASNKKETGIIRDLAKRYAEVCASDANQAARKLWEDHNSLQPTRPPVNVLHCCSLGQIAGEIDTVLDRVQTESFQELERDLRRRLWMAENVLDDTVYYPGVEVRAKMLWPENLWGFEPDIRRGETGGGFRAYPVVRTMKDLEKLRATPHVVYDRDPPEAQKLRELLDGVLDTHVNTSSTYPLWDGAGLSDAAGKLIGIEELLWMMNDSPEIIHALMAFMRDAVLANFDECEKRGDWSAADGWSYAFNDCHGLPRPAPNQYGQKMSDLWHFSHAQEFDAVGAAQHEEFLLQYQLPIMRRFGLVAYGCCDTPDHKIGMLRKIPNLRTIGIGPTSNLAFCAGQIGTDYICSWRPNPAMISFHYDLENCRKIVREGFSASRGSRVHLLLNCIMTIENDPQRIVDFANMAREESLRAGMDVMV